MSLKDYLSKPRLCRGCGKEKTTQNTRLRRSRNGGRIFEGRCVTCSREYQTRWRKTSYPKDRAKALRYRAKHEGVPCNITHEDIVVPAVCPVLGIPLVLGDNPKAHDYPTVDRIIPEKGYVKGNIVVMSWRANSIKSDATPEELRRIADFVSQFVRDGV